MKIVLVQIMSIAISQLHISRLPRLPPSLPASSIVSNLMIMVVRYILSQVVPLLLSLLSFRNAMLMCTWSDITEEVLYVLSLLLLFLLPICLSRAVANTLLVESFLKEAVRLPAFCCALL